MPTMSSSFCLAQAPIPVQLLLVKRGSNARLVPAHRQRMPGTCHTRTSRRWLGNSKRGRLAQSFEVRTQASHSCSPRGTGEGG